MMQRLAQDCKIDTVFRNWRIFNIAKPVFEIFKPMFLRQPRAELNHVRRVIDRDDFAGFFRQQLRKRPFARPKVSHVERRKQCDQRVRECFP